MAAITDDYNENYCISPEDFVIYQDVTQSLRMVYCSPFNPQDILIWTGVEHGEYIPDTSISPGCPSHIIRCFLTLVHTVMTQDGPVDKWLNAIHRLMVINYNSIGFATSKAVLPLTSVLIGFGLKLPDRFPIAYLSHINAYLHCSSVKTRNPDRGIKYDKDIWYKQWGSIDVSISELLRWSDTPRDEIHDYVRTYYKCLELAQRINLRYKPAISYYSTAINNNSTTIIENNALCTKCCAERGYEDCDENDRK